MDSSKLLQLLAPHSWKIELTLVVVVFVSAIFNYNGVSGGAELLMLSMTGLAGYYFISAFFMIEIKGVISALALKLFSIASSVCLIGLLFTILHLTGGANMLVIGVSVMGITGLMVVYLAVTAWTPALAPLLIRLILVGGISVSTLFSLMDAALVQ